jgi:DNA-binding transcriptional ArsR family regulator
MEIQIRLGQGEREVEAAVSYAISHRIRAEILALLNEDVRTHDELALLVGQSPSKIGHHIKELLDDGSIELAYVKPVRNTVQHYYRAVKMPFFSDEEVAAMPAKERQALAGVALQSSLAEALAAFWAGKMIHDPRLWLGWRWFNVDMQGRGDIADEQARFWTRMQGIEGEAATRCATSGEATKPIIVREARNAWASPRKRPHSAAASMSLRSAGWRPGSAIRKSRRCAGWQKRSRSNPASSSTNRTQLPSIRSRRVGQRHH